MTNKTNLLVIDDDAALLAGLKAILGREGYSVVTASYGAEGIRLARESVPDLVLCDLMMPPPNGFDILHALAHDPQTARVPFIFITARASEMDKVRGLRSGADDYIVKPFLREELLARIEAVLRRSRRDALSADPEAQANMTLLRGEIVRLMACSSAEWDGFVDGLLKMLALRDNETEEHAWRVLDWAARVAAKMGFSGEALHHIRWGALLHDIGKVGIPDGILLKPGPLTEEERAVMMLHPHIANQILAPLGLPKIALEIPHYHHERWDGTGYPENRSGEEIPLSARIFAVVDVWDALTSDRPYRKAWPVDRALQHLRDEAGYHFDPAVVDVFMTVLAEDRIGIIG